MKPRPNQLLVNLLDNYERLYVENHALKTLLSTANDSRIRDTWESTVKEVLRLPEVEKSLAELHSKFDALRAQVLAELDAEAALQLLLKLPVTGKPN